MSDLFSKRAQGGAIASRVDEQDGVALQLVLELLAGKWPIESADLPNTTISCEVAEDLVFTWGSEAALVVSVKRSGFTRSDAVQELKRISRLGAGLKTDASAMLALVGNVEPKTRSLGDALDSLRSVLQAPIKDDGSKITEWRNTHPDLKVERPDRLYLRQFLPRDSPEFAALAADQLRQIAPINDYTNARTESLCSIFLDKLGKARRERRTISLRWFLEKIAENGAPLPLSTGFTGYERVGSGYTVNAVEMGNLRTDVRALRSASRSAMKSHRRKNYGEVLRSILLGPVKCPHCSGSIMANFYGLTKNGFACNECGYTPYASVFYACECGQPALLISQPSVNLGDFLLELRAPLRDKCACGTRINVERLLTRTFTLNIPWPPRNVGKDLIALRKRLENETNKAAQSDSSP